jgi:hypothetical protein
MMSSPPHIVLAAIAALTIGCWRGFRAIAGQFAADRRPVFAS